MEINYIASKQGKIAEIKADGIVIKNQEDALTLLMNCLYNDVDRIILYQHNINPKFFNLRTRLAGEVLRKFSTYEARLAIIGDFSIYESKSLQKLIQESNRLRKVNFLSSREQALAIFGGLH